MIRPLSFSQRLPGFTLLETLVALVIVVTVLGAGAVINRTVFLGSRLSEDRAQANSVAEDMVGLIRLDRRISNNPTKNFANLVPYPVVADTTTVQTVQWCSDTDPAQKCSFADNRFPICGSDPAKARGACGTTPEAAKKVESRVTDEGVLIPLNRGQTQKTIWQKDAFSTSGALFSTGNSIFSDWDFYRVKISGTKVTVSNIISGLQVEQSY